MESEVDDFYDSDNCVDEIDTYDYLDEIDDASDGVAALRLREKNFTVLGKEDIHRRQEDDIVKIDTVLGVSREAALILLRLYKWRVNDVHDEWFADEERVRKAAGLLENPVVDFSGSKKFLCKICLEKLRIAKSSSVACGHPFCKNCWRTYIRTSINDGPGCLVLKCPEPSCGAAVGQDMVDMFLSKEEKEKYLNYILRSYVEENRKIKWCPAPDCDCAVEFVVGSENYDVTCGCSYSFCWNCTEEAHRPVDCDTVKKWILKNSGESENVNWILVNSKPCPKCRRPIEKNQGCMHMTCRLCKHEFCWLCLEGWITHGQTTGGFYACNRYEEGKQGGKFKEAETERIRELAKKSLDRYMHYYERWTGNQNSMSKAKADLKEVQDVKLERLRAVHAQPQSQMVFILEAWKQIIECRRVLQWTYAYGYYIPEQERIKKQFFEYLQGEAEAALERLHDCLEKEILSFYNEESPDMSFKEFRAKLIDLTRVTKNYFENLVRAFENDLADVDSTITWQCEKCTYLNVTTTTICKVCQHPW